MRTAIVQAAIAAINQGDRDSALTHVTPDVGYDLTLTDSPPRGAYRGFRGDEVAHLTLLQELPA